MSSDDRVRDTQPLVVPFADAESWRRSGHVRPDQSPSRDRAYFEMLSSPLREEAALTDDEWRQRSVDNIYALLKANAELRALAVKLSEILTARIGVDGNILDQAARVAAEFETPRN